MYNANTFLQSNPTDSQALAERIRELRIQIIADGWDTRHGPDCEQALSVLVTLEKVVRLRCRNE